MTGTGSRAVRFDRYGGREVLYVADVPMPAPAAGEVVVAVRAAGINPGETNIRTGALHDRFPATFPSGQGSDLAGVVTAVGESAGELAAGDEALGGSGCRLSATFPSGQGSDLAGVVTAVGESAGELAAGDEVLGFSWRRSSTASRSI